jgi:signal transduction histidine kinase/ActR/RegA family two-component response regulator
LSATVRVADHLKRDEPLTDEVHLDVSRHSQAHVGWLRGTGEMIERVRAFDWAATPVGPIEGWPSVLKHAVATVLHSRVPMFLCWGAELTQFYNDAYVPGFGPGKHPLALGQSARICWPEIWAVIGPQLEEVMRDGQPRRHEDPLVPIHRKGSAEDVFWSYGYSPVIDEHGSILGTLAICTETAGRGKDEFLATVSHELRTPLNAILGWSRMLAAGNVAEADVQKACERIQRNAETQVRLIDDLLDASRVITGKLRLEIAPMDFACVVGAALDVVAPAAAEKGIKLLRSIEPLTGAMTGDADRLQQVVWNLANNAIKFTPRDGEVRVALRQLAQDVQLVVSDTGQGIDPGFIPHVFERFRQAEDGSSRRHGGLGLGLALVRDLVEAHGGTVGVKSGGAGRGAEFTVTLPTSAAPPVRNPPPRSTKRDGDPLMAVPPSLAGRRILIVDDEEDARFLVAAVLRRHGADVTIVDHAEAALAEVQTSAYAAVVTDVGMAGVDGYELVRRIRAQGPSHDRLPVVALTGYVGDEDRQLALAAGFSAHLSKPVHPDQLCRVMAELIQRANG